MKRSIFCPPKAGRLRQISNPSQTWWTLNIDPLEADNEYFPASALSGPRRIECKGRRYIECNMTFSPIYVISRDFWTYLNLTNGFVI